LLPEGLVKIADGDRILTETVYSLESFSYYDLNTASDHTYYTKMKKNYQRYFFDMETGELCELGPKKVIELAGDKKKEIKKFIRTNKLKLNTTADYIAVLDEYHRLTE
jgi:hypothetical protein